MVKELLKDFSLKWWSSLEAQQKLTVGMAVIIIILVVVIGAQEGQKEDIRKEGYLEASKQQARADACYESQMIYIIEKEKISQDMLFKYIELKQKANEADNN